MIMIISEKKTHTFFIIINLVIKYNKWREQFVFIYFMTFINSHSQIFEYVQIYFF